MEELVTILYFSINNNTINKKMKLALLREAAIRLEVAQNIKDRSIAEDKLKAIKSIIKFK